MSEDVRPKKFWVDDITERTCAPWDHPELGAHKLNWPDNEKVIKVIELEPTMRLIDDMAESFQEWLDDTEEDFSEQPGWKSCKEALEKYKKFKEALK